MDQVRPQDGKRRFGIDRAPLDWPADPYQTPSGGGHGADPGQKQDIGDRITLEGIDTGRPVTEARPVER